MFNIEIPTKIFFGQDTFELVGEKSKTLGNSALIITTSKTLFKNGIIADLENKLKQEKIETYIEDGISPNPKVSEINNIYNKMCNKKIDFVIGIGGGSSIDAAKAIAVSLGSKNSDISDFMEVGKIVPETTLDILAIPTTAGTGSELSKGAIITDKENNLKMGIRGNSIIPKIAIVDPQLTLSVPLKVTRETGFDVFSHAFESYLSQKSNYFTKMISEKSMSIIYNNLPNLLNDLNNINLREKIMFASMLVGINLLSAGTCLPHRLQYPFGAKTDTSHGLGLALIYPSWLNRIDTKHVKDLSYIFNCEDKKVTENIKKFITDLGFEKKFYDFNVEVKDVDSFRSLIKGNLKKDPTYYDGIIEEIYNELMEVN